MHSRLEIIVIIIGYFQAMLYLGLCNDPPHIESQNRVIIKPESTKIGTVLTTISAKDTDGPHDLDFTVGDLPTGNLVRLDHLKKVPGNKWTVDVVLKHELDRDFHPATRTLLFEVTDGAYKMPVKYKLVITDEPDEAPFFLNLPHILTVSETKKPGSVLFKVNSTDPDTGSGGHVTYSLELDASISNPFKIDPDTGVIVVMDALDYEKTRSYNCVITAQDATGLKNTSTLAVTLTDGQDTPPVFDLPSYTAQIPENEPVGSLITTVAAKDGDLTHQNTVLLTLHLSPCSEMFSLNGTTGEITLKDKLDRESSVLEDVNAVCVLNVTAIEDNGNRLQYGPFTSWAVVMVTILDVNDNHPTFDTGRVKATTGKHVTQGAPIVFTDPEMVTVHDYDRGPNGLMEIYLSTIGGQHDHVFRVSPQTAYSQAQIYLTVHNTTALRDYHYNILTVELYAREMSSKTHIAMVTISIDVEDTHTQCPRLPLVG